MSLKQKRLLFYFIIVLLVLTGPVTVILNTKWDLLPMSNVLIATTIQRMAGLVAFTLLFIQILLGSSLDKWLKILGAKAYKYHIIIGTLAYMTIFIHPLIYFYLRFDATKILDPFFIYSEFCILCETKNDLYLTFGRVSFWLITATILAAIGRTYVSLRRNWRYIHILNYIAFFFVAYHAMKLGTDTLSIPFVVVYYGAIIIVSAIVLKKIAVLFKENFKLK